MNLQHSNDDKYEAFFVVGGTQLRSSVVLTLFQIVGRFGISMFIDFFIHLDRYTQCLCTQQGLRI
jgi:hypothetical protein